MESVSVETASEGRVVGKRQKGKFSQCEVDVNEANERNCKVYIFVN